MGLEAANYINGLIATNPTSGDPKSAGDDHLRLIKAALLATFPALTGAVTVSQADINAIAGATTTGALLKVITQLATDNSTNAASTAMVQAAILAASGITVALPGQSGNAGLGLITNGSTASWGSSAADSIAILNFLNS